MKLFQSIAVALVMAAEAFASDLASPPYTWNTPPKYSLNTQYKPLKGWRIEKLPAGKTIFPTSLGRFKGTEEPLYILHFDIKEYNALQGTKLLNRPVFLGWGFILDQTTCGLARTRVYNTIGQQYLALEQPSFTPADNDPWTQVAYPTLLAESQGDHLVINSYDYAGMTLGAGQLAAHTGNDLIPLMKDLLQNPELKKDPYANPKRWFPEFSVKKGKLCLNGKSIEGGARTAKLSKWFREDFVRAMNPYVRPKAGESDFYSAIDPVELHVAARWLMWSQSPKMRQAQFESLKRNLVYSLHLIDPQLLIKVDAQSLAYALVILHWSEGYRSRVNAILSSDNPKAQFDLLYQDDALRLAYCGNNKTSSRRIKERLGAANRARTETLRSFKYDRRIQNFVRLSPEGINADSGHASISSELTRSRSL